MDQSGHTDPADLPRGRMPDWVLTKSSDNHHHHNSNNSSKADRSNSLIPLRPSERDAVVAFPRIRVHHGGETNSGGVSRRQTPTPPPVPGVLVSVINNNNISSAVVPVKGRNDREAVESGVGGGVGARWLDTLAALGHVMIRLIQSILLLFFLLAVIILWWSMQSSGGAGEKHARDGSASHGIRHEQPPTAGVDVYYPHRAPQSWQMQMDRLARYKNDLGAARSLAELTVPSKQEQSVRRGQRNTNKKKGTSAEKLRAILDEIPSAEEMSDALTAMGNYASSADQFDALLANQNARALREGRDRLEAILSQMPRPSSSWSSSTDPRLLTRLADSLYYSPISKAAWAVRGRQRTLAQLRDLEESLLANRGMLVDMQWRANRDESRLKAGQRICKWVGDEVDPGTLFAGLMTGENRKRDETKNREEVQDSEGTCFAFEDPDGTEDDGDDDDDNTTHDPQITYYQTSSFAPGLENGALRAVKSVATIAGTVCRELNRWSGGDEDVRLGARQRQREFEARLADYGGLINRVRKTIKKC